jgi:hypothetical protein
VTLTDIRTQPIGRVRAFVNEFAKTANLRDQAVLDLIHAARARLTVEYGLKELAQMKRRIK